jgi:hypothetical protein
MRTVLTRRQMAEFLDSLFEFNHFTASHHELLPEFGKFLFIKLGNVILELESGLAVKREADLGFDESGSLEDLLFEEFWVLEEVIVLVFGGEFVGEDFKRLEVMDEEGDGLFLIELVLWRHCCELSVVCECFLD